MSSPALTLLCSDIHDEWSFDWATKTTEPNLTTFLTSEVYTVWASVAHIVMEKPALREAGTAFLKHCFPQVDQEWLRIPSSSQPCVVGESIRVEKHEDRYEIFSCGRGVETLPPDEATLDRFLHFFHATPYMRPMLAPGKEIPSFVTRDVYVFGAICGVVGFVLAMILFL